MAGTQGGGVKSHRHRGFKSGWTIGLDPGRRGGDRRRGDRDYDRGPGHADRQAGRGRRGGRGGRASRTTRSAASARSSTRACGILCSPGAAQGGSGQVTVYALTDHGAWGIGLIIALLAALAVAALLVVLIRNCRTSTARPDSCWRWRQVAANTANSPPASGHRAGAGPDRGRGDRPGRLHECAHRRLRRGDGMSSGGAQPRHDRRLAVPGRRRRGPARGVLGGQGQGGDPRLATATRVVGWTRSTSART